jgi:hypothetical protein
MKMLHQLSDIVTFRGDRLFNGAVNIEWFGSDPDKAKLACEAFVFHGPEYHGVSQKDIGDSHGHKLIDTANFTRSIIRRCYGLEDQPFTLAIAGYGTGKSHLGLTLANLINSPQSESAAPILNALNSADDELADDISRTIREASQPCLVITLNGMRGFDLSAEVTKQLTTILKRDGQTTKHLDELRPRFGQAVSLIEMSNETVKSELLSFTEVESVTSLVRGLEQHDERLYSKVYDFFDNKGMPIRVLAGESVRDVIDIAVREYCGAGKPYRTLLILFDEFGKYTEFATVRSQIAGNGVLQDLFEAVQANSNSVCFVGFIQFELSSYVKRIAPEYKNEILRYITRYQSADRLYLSINLETLIANLIEKKKPELLSDEFDNESSRNVSGKTITKLNKWFPHSQNFRTWNDVDLFHSVIRKGCWPLSPYSTWLLYFLASAGKHLQERSALALLGESFSKFQMHDLESIDSWTISPVDLCSELLLNELLNSEEIGQQGSIAHSYTSVMSKHGTRFSDSQIRILKAILLASKLGLVGENKSDTIQALAEFSGNPIGITNSDVTLLQEELNVIEWDDAFKAFDILGDAVPRTQFLQFVRQRVASAYDESGKSSLFASKAAEWCDLLTDLDCDFAEVNRIDTKEWKYTSITTNLDYLAQQIKMAGDQWLQAVDVHQGRGTVIYCYAEPSRSEEEITTIANKILKKAAREFGVNALPVLVVFIHDIEGNLGQSLAEYSVLQDISENDRAKFGNLVGAQNEKLLKSIRESISSLIKKRHFVLPVKNDAGIRRLSQIGNLIFSEIYKKPISFPFDGFKTKNGNGPNTCYELTYELMHGKLDYNGVTAKPVKTKNRALAVLRDNWGIFNKNGSISRRPAHPIIRSLTEKWDDQLAKDQKLPVAEVLREICKPPYGANIASAGLFLGVYIAPRFENLVVMKRGLQLGIGQWIEENLFRGKFLNLASMQSVDLMQLGEASSEWENLLDEWEQSESYLSRVNYLQRAIELKERTPIPPMLVYREDGLQQLSKAAFHEIQKVKKEQDKSWDRIERGYKHHDCSSISRGAAGLKTLLEQMESESGRWSEQQLTDLVKGYAMARQYAVQSFDQWLPSEGPNSDSPSDVGDFKHKMLRLIGANLKKIELPDEYAKLEKYTLNAVKNAEALTDAKLLIRNIEGWLNEHSSALKTKRIVEARVLKDKGLDFSVQLQKISRKFEIPAIKKLRDELSEFNKNLGEIEAALFKKASALWDSNVAYEHDLDRLSTEIDSLLISFDGLDSDLEDLLSMKKAIKIYRSCYGELNNTSLSWDQFNSMKDYLIERFEPELEEDEVPWNLEEVLDFFSNAVSKDRKNRSEEWMKKVFGFEMVNENMNASDANALLREISSPPLFLTKEHSEQLDTLRKKITQHLSNLNIEWLIEKFKELTLPKKTEFLEIANRLLD